MRKVIIAMSTLSFLIPTSAFANHGSNDGGDNGNHNDQRRCHNSQGKCKGSFSPDFQDSPVNIQDNQICVMPGSCTQKEKSEK